MDFKKFQSAIQRQFNAMSKHALYRVNVDKNLLWNTYLASFPAGSDPIYKEQTEHTCNCCKSFIRAVGDMVAIIDGKVVSLWDIEVNDSDNNYQVVTNSLAELVKSFTIDDTFLHPETDVGVKSNFQLLADKTTLTWDHFQLQLPRKFVVQNSEIGSKLSELRSTKDVMLRGLAEITPDAVDTVLELISQNSLYRGEEQKFVLTEFRKLKVKFDKAADKNVFCWSMLETVPASISRIRNTAIGTLLTDLSEGYELEDCIKSFESKVAPANYKRPTAIITKAMIEKAKQTIEGLGLTASLNRKYAVLEDISVANVLFADRSIKPRIDNVFDELIQSTPKTAKNLDKVEEMGIEQFIANILPTATSIEVMFENQHVPNLFSLIAPADLTAKTMFKWSNGFSWSYTGEMADSIKERVKKAGGTVVGDLCCRLAWDYKDDLDFHMKEPGGGHIYYGCRRSKSACGGELDLDANGSDGYRDDPAENIYYSDKKKMKDGIYTLSVNNFSRRSDGVGFVVEIEFNGITHSFPYDKVIKTDAYVHVADIEYSKKTGFSIVKSLPSTQATKTIWDIPTGVFHKVNAMMLSPNYWDGQGIGNKHYFFALEGCANDGTARGFFNEFLSSEFDAHRKVLEVVGSKMRTDAGGDQISGLGFSSTQRNSILCRVVGSFSRLIKINF